jgi:hypothetical protein
MAQSQLSNGGWTLHSVVGDCVPLAHLLAADSDLLDDHAQRVVHDAELPPGCSDRRAYHANRNLSVTLPFLPCPSVSQQVVRQFGLVRITAVSVSG